MMLSDSRFGSMVGQWALWVAWFGFLSFAVWSLWFSDHPALLAAWIIVFAVARGIVVFRWGVAVRRPTQSSS